MNDPRPKPTRTAGDILREMAERAKQRIPPPVPPTDAPPPPHHQPSENDE